MHLGAIKILACPGCSSPMQLPSIVPDGAISARHWSDGKLEMFIASEPPRITRCVSCRAYFWLDDAPRLGQLTPEQQPAWLLHARLDDPRTDRAAVLQMLREQGSPGYADELEKLLAASALVVRTGQEIAQAFKLRDALEEAGVGLHVVVETEPASQPRASWGAAPRVRWLLLGELREALAQGLGRSREREMELRRQFWWALNDARRLLRPGWKIATENAWTEEERAELETFVGMLDESDDIERLTKAELYRELGRFEDALYLLAFPFPEQLMGAASQLRELASQRVAGLARLG